MKKLFVIALVLSFVFAGAAQAANTATVNVTVSIGQTISVTLSSGSVNMGSGAESGILDTTGGSAITATNNGNIIENLELSVGSSANWTASASAVGADQFMADFSTDTGPYTWATINPAGGTSLVSGVAAGGTKDFHLQIQLPSSTANVGVTQTIPVTVTASAS